MKRYSFVLRSSIEQNMVVCLSFLLNNVLNNFSGEKILVVATGKNIKK